MSEILNPLYTAVSWVLITFHDLLSFTNNEDLQWSVGIIALVILIRIILIPLFVKQIKSQRALTALQPHMRRFKRSIKMIARSNLKR
jgi:YidC/Oxa1 family membrane protein insertase